MYNRLLVRIDTPVFDRLMVSNRYNVSSLARKVGVSRTTISNARNGKSLPSTAIMDRICEALNCTPGDIIKEVDE